jgi:PKD repeat protein
MGGHSGLGGWRGGTSWSPATHGYASDGTYTVTATVAAGLAATASTTVTITTAGDPDCSPPSVRPWCLDLHPYNLHMTAGATSPVPLQVVDEQKVPHPGVVTYHLSRPDLIPIDSEGCVTTLRTESSTKYAVSERRSSLRRDGRLRIAPCPGTGRAVETARSKAWQVLGTLVCDGASGSGRRSSGGTKRAGSARGRTAGRKGSWAAPPVWRDHRRTTTLRHRRDTPMQNMRVRRRLAAVQTLLALAILISRCAPVLASHEAPQLVGSFQATFL